MALHLLSPRQFTTDRKAEEDQKERQDSKQWVEKAYEEGNRESYGEGSHESKCREDAQCR